MPEDLPKNLPENGIQEVQEKDQREQELLAQLRQTQLAYHMAVEMGQFKAGFLARTSHELRSPLNSIISLHQLILSDLCDNPAEERETIAQAQFAASKMLALLDELVSVAKVQHGTYALQIQPLRLADVLEEVHALIHLQVQDRGLRLEIHPADPEIYILADPRWFRQVLVNLIDPSTSQLMEGSICLTAQPDPDNQQVHVWIEDQRLAYLQEDLNLLKTENLSSQSSSQAIAKPSSGLSLLIDQSLMAQMNGRLEVFTLPVETVSEAIDGASITRIRCSIPQMIPEP